MNPEAIGTFDNRLCREVSALFTPGQKVFALKIDSESDLAGLLSTSKETQGIGGDLCLQKMIVHFEWAHVSCVHHPAALPDSEVVSHFCLLPSRNFSAMSSLSLPANFSTLEVPSDSP